MNKIVVYYVSGETKEKENTQDNINVLNEQLKQQALAFRNLKTKLLKEINDSFFVPTIGTIFSAFGIALLQSVDNSLVSKIIIGPIAGGAILGGATIFGIYGAAVIKEIKRNKDIDKYEYYNNMQEDLEYQRKTCPFKLEAREANLNYNTIDDYSTKEVKQIHDKFQKRRVYQK